MNEREKKLQQLMDKNLKISTLFAYNFKTNEIVKAINNMKTNLPKQQWYFLQFQDYKKQRKINSKKNYISIEKMVTKSLLEIKRLNFIINQNKIAIEKLSAKLNKIDLFIKKQQLINAALNNQQAKQEEPLDLSLSNHKQLLLLEIKNNMQQSSDITSYQQDLNNMIEKQLQEIFFLSKKIFNQNSNSYGSNFNDSERHLVSEQLSGNDYLNATNEETYSDTISNRQRQVTI